MTKKNVIKIVWNNGKNEPTLRFVMKLHHVHLKTRDIMYTLAAIIQSFELAFSSKMNNEKEIIFSARVTSVWYRGPALFVFTGILYQEMVMYWNRKMSIPN